MPYVQRDASGKVCGVYANPQPEYAEEFLADDDSLVAAYLNPPPPPVTQVTPRQARLALLEAGLLGAIETKLRAKNRAVQIAWDYVTVIDRNDALIAAIAKELNLTDAAVDLLFKNAATK